MAQHSARCLWLPHGIAVEAPILSALVVKPRLIYSFAGATLQQVAAIVSWDLEVHPAQRLFIQGVILILTKGLRYCLMCRTAIVKTRHNGGRWGRGGEETVNKNCL